MCSFWKKNKRVKDEPWIETRGLPKVSYKF